VSGVTDLILSELERDALTELVNIGVSRAAASLRKMIGEQVFLSVPSVDIMTERMASVLIAEREVDELVAVRQAFSGAFSGRALLIFPQASSLELVRAVVGEAVPPEDMAELEEEALAETGNIILNGCLASMANMLRRQLTMSIPEVLHCSGGALFGGSQATRTGDGPIVLFLYINFSVRERDIRGYIAMLMDLPSLSALKMLIAEFIERVLADDGEPAPAGRAAMSGAGSFHAA
jgi:chemotaxis protein CheC